MLLWKMQFKLFEILSDAEVMKYYPKPFDAECVKGWIKWNQENYKNYGFGLWAVCLKAKPNKMIFGVCNKKRYFV